MKRRTAALLSLGMVLAMLLSFAVVASADTKTGSTTVTVGNTDIDQNNYSSAVTARSSNESVAKVEVVRSGSYDKVYITGVSIGSATVSYEALIAGESTYHTYQITVTVTASAADSSTLSAQTIGVGATYGTASYTGVTNVFSTNPGVATAIVESTGIVRVTGVAVGSAEISFTHTENGITLSKKLPITVSANATTTDSIDLAVGGVFTVQYAEISSATSANSNIAKVETKSVEANKVTGTITGVADGTTTVTINYKETTSSANTSRTITVRVGSAMGGGTAASTSTDTNPQFQTVDQPKIASSKIPANTATEGIYIPKRTISATNGKTYRVPNIKLDGKTTKASELRWVAEDANVLEVNSKTGTFKCIAKGGSKLFAVDMNGKYMNYVTVTVK